MRIWLWIMLFCVSASASDISLGNQTEKSERPWVATSLREYWRGMFRTYRYHDSIGDLDSFLVRTGIGVSGGRVAYSTMNQYYVLRYHDSIGNLDSIFPDTGNSNGAVRHLYEEMRGADSTGDWRTQIARMKLMNDLGLIDGPRDEKRGAAGRDILEAWSMLYSLADSLETSRDNLAQVVDNGGLTDIEREEGANIFWAVTSAALAAQNSAAFASGLTVDLFDDEHNCRSNLCKGLQLNLDHLSRYNSYLKKYSTVAERAYLVVECQKASGFIVQVADAINKLLEKHCQSE